MGGGFTSSGICSRRCEGNRRPGLSAMAVGRGRRFYRSCDGFCAVDMSILCFLVELERYQATRTSVAARPEHRTSVSPCAAEA